MKKRAQSKGGKKKTGIKKPAKKSGQKKQTSKQPEVAFEKTMEPVKKKFGLKNVLQAIVGAILLAIPIGFTEETWRLGETLPMSNIIMILVFSLFLVTLFAYRNLSKNKPGFYWYDLAKRVVVMYFISFVMVTILLLIIQRAPWSTDWVLAFKRTIIVAFPSCLSATIAGNLR